MIRLDVAEYCHTCSAFKACTKTRVEYCDNDKIVNTIITCEHKGMCDGIKKFLENERKRREG